MPRQDRVIAKVLKTVREQIKERDPQKELDLQVGDEDYRVETDADGDWTYVCVTPGKPGVRPYDFAEMLGKIEEELHEQGYEHVQLVPTLAEWNP